MRPVLNAALRRIWRDADTLQLGVDPRHCVVLDGLGTHGETVLALLDGTRDWAGVIASATSLGVAPDDAQALLDLLLRAGALEDSAVLAPLPARARQRLAVEAAELSLLCAPGGSAATLRGRGQATVLVARCDRLGSSVGVLLAAAGIGRLLFRDEHDGVRADGTHATPRALVAADAAERAGESQVDAAVRRPSADDCADADLVVLTGLYAGGDRSLIELLTDESVPWLSAGVRETCGVVGPLVLPGRSACPRCLDLARADRDPVWPVVAAQLAADVASGREAGGAALLSVLAGLTCAEALAHLGGPSEPRCVDATLEVRLPEWSVRRRAWQPHPACGCAERAS